MKKIVLLIFLCSFTISCRAQLGPAKGVKGIGVNGGISRYGYVMGVEYVQYFSNRFYLSLRPTLELGQYLPTSTKYRSIGMVSTVYFSLWSVKEKFYFSLGSGLSLFADRATASEVPVSDAIKVGVNGAVEAQYYVTGALALFATFNQNYLFTNPEWGKVRWMSNLGLRYHF